MVLLDDANSEDVTAAVAQLLVSRVKMFEGRVDELLTLMRTGESPASEMLEALDRLERTVARSATSEFMKAATAPCVEILRVARLEVESYLTP